MNIENSILRWEAYSKMFLKIVDTLGKDIESDNVVSPIEAVFLCNLHALLISASYISEHALRNAKTTQQAIQKEVETEHE
ncbi:MAG: hypothetical protein IJP85_05780 [Synergistaceae bacterium]|nr:hypothetical protein [Synergistaceae bacterium]